MGWERRRRGGWYYTRARRVGGRVIKDYVGTGPVAEAAAQLDVLKRRERRAAREQREVDHHRYELLVEHLQRFCRWTGLLSRVALLERGYYQHRRSEWRRRANVQRQEQKPDVA